MVEANARAVHCTGVSSASKKGGSERTFERLPARFWRREREHFVFLAANGIA
jgi:hypothetical protein